ncbi:hypothetical protein [Rhodoferax sp. GW822-FHT02A01]|uniref:hypothetical protein n=1 Tax=Rhodoferax sp. GW822-FHT02A01 TaxID=3141537 RepID=UPI00315D5B64
MSKFQTTAAIIEVCHQIDLMQLDYKLSEKLKRLLRIVWNKHGFAGFDKVDQLEFASNQLNAKKTRTEIRDRLKSNYSVSRTEAYRIITKAKELSQEIPDFGTRKESN